MVSTQLYPSGVAMVADDKVGENAFLHFMAAVRIGDDQLAGFPQGTHAGLCVRRG